MSALMYVSILFPVVDQVSYSLVMNSVAAPVRLFLSTWEPTTIKTRRYTHAGKCKVARATAMEC